MVQGLKKEKELYSLLVGLIEEKKIEYLKYVLQMIPKSVNTCNKECSLLYWVINEYLNTLEKGLKEDILYYNRISHFILFQETLNISKKEQMRIIQRLDRFLEMSIKKATQNQKEDVEFLKNEIKDLKSTKDKNKNKSKQEQIKNFECSPKLELFRNQKLRLIQKNKIGIANYRVEDYTVTIDNNNTIIREDALSCRKIKNGYYILGIHIVSVLEYVPYHSNEIQYILSKDRLSNITKGRENLFSKNIANQISLERDQERYTRSYYFEVDPNGEIISEKFQKTITKCNDTLSYEEADRILKDEKRPNQKGTKEVLKNLNEVYNLVANKYFKNKFTKFSNSNQIVEFTAMLTGSRVANYFADRRYPCLYLMNNWDKLEQYNELKNIYQKLKDYFDSYIPPMESVQLDIKYLPIINYEQKGLPSNLYCQCTAPLRNGSSIFMEYLLQQLYDQQPTEKELIEAEKEATKKALQFNANRIVAKQKKLIKQKT